MAGRRRAERRANVQALSVGTSAREARILNGLTRDEAARRAGISRATWDRIERGTPSVTFQNLVAATDAVGLDLVCNAYPGRPPGLRDSGQLGIAQFFQRIAHQSLRITLEEQAGDHGEAIDQVFWGPTEIVAVEIERNLVNWQLQWRRWTAKRTWLAARHARVVRLVIAVADTPRNRAAVAPFRSLIDATLPAGTRAVLRALRTGNPLEADGLCWVRERRIAGGGPSSSAVGRPAHR